VPNLGHLPPTAKAVTEFSEDVAIKIQSGFTLGCKPWLKASAS